MQNKHLKLSDSCPDCKMGLLVIKMRKDYQPFLSCDSYPDCRFASNLTNKDYKKWLEKNKI